MFDKCKSNYINNFKLRNIKYFSICLIFIIQFIFKLNLNP